MKDKENLSKESAFPRTTFMQGSIGSIAFIRKFCFKWI